MIGWQSGWAACMADNGLGSVHIYRVDIRKDVAQIACRVHESKPSRLKVGAIGTRIGASKRLLALDDKKCGVCVEIAQRAVKVTR